MDTVTNTERRHAGWLEQQRQAARPNTERVPTTVTRNGESFDVLGAVYLPGVPGRVPAHVVLYQEREGTYTVHTLIHHRESSYLHEGEYDLTYPAAARALLARAARELRS